MKIDVLICGNPLCACSDYTPERIAEIRESMTEDAPASPRED